MISQAFADHLSAPGRRLSLAGEISLSTGACLSFDGSQALSFSLSEGSNTGNLLGGAFSAVCALTLYDREDIFRPYSLIGARVQLYLCAGDERAPLACFFVTRVSRQEGSKQLHLSGSDALGVAFETAFEDDFLYPVTLGEMAAQMAARVGYALDTNFPNAGVVIQSAPDWGKISLRQALGHAAGAAGCFAAADRSGDVHFRQVWQDEVLLPVQPDQILGQQCGELCFGPLSALSIQLDGAPRTEGPLVIRAADDPVSPMNCLSLAGNPLFSWQADHTAALAMGLMDALQGMRLIPSRLTWRGNPERCLGDRLPMLLPSGERQEMMITRQTLSFSQGFWMQSDCTAAADQQTTGRIFTASGMLNAARLSGSINGALIQDGSIAASSLMAGSITAYQLAAAAVTAEKLAAGAVEASHLSAGAVDAEKLSAHAVEARHLSADALDAASAHILKADIDWAEIESLQAAIAKITNAEIQNADIDFARIKDLNADAAIITKGNAGELYISRLSVTEANLVSLSVGQLMVKGADGAFYALSVDETGAVKAEKKLIENGDIRDLSIDAGQKIIEGSVTAATLNAREIFGESALIRELIASTLDVDTLFAREAMIARINALDITGNESIRLYVKSQEEMSAFLRVTENGLEIGRVGDTAVFRADNRTLEVTNVKTERLGLAQRMSQKEEWAVSAYNSGLSIKWIGGDA